MSQSFGSHAPQLSCGSTAGTLLMGFPPARNFPAQAAFHQASLYAAMCGWGESDGAGDGADSSDELDHQEYENGDEYSDDEGDGLDDLDDWDQLDQWDDLDPFLIDPMAFDVTNSESALA